MNKQRKRAFRVVSPLSSLWVADFIKYGIGHVMTDTQQLAFIIRSILNDRIEHSTQAHLAFETASLRAFVFATLEALDHLRGHVERDEVRDREQLLDALRKITKNLEDHIANLEDVRLELRRIDRDNPH